ncbi:MAG: DUF2065 domain-containing protein [Hyphomicrobiaceae bacterium]|nr:DUF2065 domain-containing protein [Hyphomicrobiaceae bacterium]MCB2053788.1 DUF2065 domain-containing protein [Geminicoccaceae bacterium]MCC0008279.1 DUF2065 domain-containing protein [Hyphomicrobiaceae bacterium]
MNDLIVAVGLVLVLEGLVWALAPDQGRRMAALAAGLPERTLRRAGWTAIAAGALVVWLVRG